MNRDNEQYRCCHHEMFPLITTFVYALVPPNDENIKQKKNGSKLL